MKTEQAMSDEFSDNRSQISMEGHSVPVMQRVFTGNGANVPTMQSIPPTAPHTSQSTGQTSRTQQLSASSANKSSGRG